MVLICPVCSSPYVKVIFTMLCDSRRQIGHRSLCTRRVTTTSRASRRAHPSQYTMCPHGTITTRGGASRQKTHGEEEGPGDSSGPRALSPPFWGRLQGSPALSPPPHPAAASGGASEEAAAAAAG